MTETQPMSALSDPALATAIWAGMTVLLLLWGRLRADLVALLSLAGAAIAGLVPVDEVGTGFTAAPALVMAASGVTATALDRSGLTAWPARLSARRAAPHGPALAGLGAMTMLAAALYGRAGARTALLAAVTGGPGAGVLRPVVLLAGMLGGTATLLGGVANLLVAELRRRADGQAFALLDFLPVGAIVCLLGLPVLVLALRSRGEDAAAPGMANDTGVASLRGYTSEVLAPAGAAVVGRSLADLEAAEDGLRVTGIVREEFRRFEARPDWLVEPGDVLVLACAPDVLQRWLERYGVRLVGSGDSIRSAGVDQLGVAEAVVTPASGLVGRTPDEARLEDRFGLSLLAVGRDGPGPAGRLRRTKLRAGDVVVLQGRLDAMNATLSALGCLKLAERRLRLGGGRANPVPLLVLLAALVLAAAGTLPLWLAMLAGVLVVATLFLSLPEVYDAVPWPGIVTVGALLPLAGALIDTGAAATAARWLAPGAMFVGTHGTVAAVLVASMAAAAALGPVAAVLLLAPVAMALAPAVGKSGPLSVDMLLIAVALGASVDIASRQGMPVALLAGPGRGRRAGLQVALALAAVVAAVGTLAIPAVWAVR